MNETNNKKEVHIKKIPKEYDIRTYFYNPNNHMEKKIKKREVLFFNSKIFLFRLIMRFDYYISQINKRVTMLLN